MIALRHGLDLSNTFDSAVYATACAAFWGCRRLGELLIPSPGKFDPSRHVTRLTKGIRWEHPEGSSYIVIYIPWTKTTKTEGANVILTDSREPTSPTAFNHHMTVNADIPHNAPLFAFETGDRQWSPMTRDWFLERCNEIWDGAGLERLSGHCFRIGGATELLLRGNHLDIVATLGGWKSHAFLEYWRKIKEILPTFISKSGDESRLETINMSMTTRDKGNGRRKHVRRSGGRMRACNRIPWDSWHPAFKKKHEFK